MKKTIAEQKAKILSATIHALHNALPKLNKQFTKSAIYLKRSVMRTTPAYPLLAFTTAQSVKLCYSEEEISHIRLSDFQYQGEQQYIYDSLGNKWMFRYSEPPFHVNFWNELRNPGYVSKIEWKLNGQYKLPELKKIFYSLLEKNDELLTEHESEDYLKSLLENSSSFEEVTNILKKYVFEVNESELWREQENRVSQ